MKANFPGVSNEQRKAVVAGEQDGLVRHGEWIPTLVVIGAVVAIGAGIGALVLVTKLVFWAMGWG